MGAWSFRCISGGSWHWESTSSHRCTAQCPRPRLFHNPTFTFQGNTAESGWHYRQFSNIFKLKAIPCKQMPDIHRYSRSASNYNKCLSECLSKCLRKQASFSFSLQTSRISCAAKDLVSTLRCWYWGNVRCNSCTVSKARMEMSVPM